MKKKRIQSPKQKKALARNWCKGLITCNIKHLDQAITSKGLSFSEQMKVLKCKRIFEDMLKEWEPML